MILCGLLFLLLAALLLACSRQATTMERQIVPACRHIVRTLHLTDLALWSEARYTRHPSQADWFAAFQDSPAAPDHFPAGSLLAPLPNRPATRIEFRHRTQGGRP